MKLKINRATIIIDGDVSDPLEVWNGLLLAANAARLTILSTDYHIFYPEGFSGTIILGESHIAIHTFPEHGKAWIEIATCDESGDSIPRFIAAARIMPFVEELEVVSRG